MEYKLSDICSGITDGSHNPPAGISNSDYLMLSSKNIFDDEITFDAPRYLSEEQFVVENKRTRIKPGDILMTIVGTVGRTAIVPDGISTITLQRSVAVLHPLKDICFSRYLMYALRSKRKFFESEAHGVAQKGIYLKQLSNIIVDVPELERQEATVQILDFVQNIIKKRHEELDKLDELIKARFVEMFGDPGCNEKGWPTKPLLSMGFCKNGMNFHYDDSGVELNCLGVGDFKDYSIIADTATLPTVSLNEMPSPEYLLQDDDIVFVRSNGNKKMVGRSVAVYPGSVPTTFSGFCIRFRRNDDLVITPYLLRVLKAESMRQKMYGRGANIQNLNQHTLSSLYIPVPPKTMQEEFATFVAQVDKSKYQAEPNSRKYHIHRLRKQYQELTDSLFLYFTKLFEVIILQKGICQTCIFQSFTIHAALS